MNASAKIGASCSTRRSCASSPTTTLGPMRQRPRAKGSRPSSACTSVVLPDPLGPTSAMRSAHPMSSVRGPSVKSPRSTTASSRRTTTSPDRAASLMLKCRSQPSQGFSTASSDSSARSVRRARAASRSVRLMRKSRCALSLSRGRFFSRARRSSPTGARVAPGDAARPVGTRRPRRPLPRGRARPHARPGSRPSRRRRCGPYGSARRAPGPRSPCGRERPGRATRSPCPRSGGPRGPRAGTGRRSRGRWSARRAG